MGNDKKKTRQKPDVRTRHGSKGVDRRTWPTDRPAPGIPSQLKKEKKCQNKESLSPYPVKEKQLSSCVMTDQYGFGSMVTTGKDSQISDKNKTQSDPLCKTCVEKIYGKTDERWKEAKLELDKCCSCRKRVVTMRIKL